MLRETHCAAVALRLSLLSVALSFAHGAAAEDLMQVYHAARTHDASLQAATALVRSAAPRAAQAEALLRPSASVTASSRRNRYERSEIGLGPAAAHDTANSATLTLRQPLFNRAAAADIDRARTGLEVAKVDFEATRQDFVIRVAQSYFDVLASQEVLAAAQSNQESLAGQLASATRNYEAGTGLVTDVRDAQARYDLALSQALSAGNDLRLRLMALERLAGRPGVRPNPLATPVMLPAIFPDSLQHWLDASATGNLDIRRAELALASAGSDLRRAKAEHLPTVDVVGSVGRDRNTGSGAALTPGGTTGSVGVELNMPLFSGFATSNRISESVLLEEKARQDLEATRRSAAEATEQAYFQLKTAYGQVKALEAAEESGRASLEGTRLGYRAGVRLNLDVLNAQTLLFQTQRDLAKARNDALMGQLKLRRVAGELTVERLEEINRLISR